MSGARTIKTFDANYGRVGEICVIKGVCDLCGEEKLCVYIDGSEGEYGGAFVCKDCVVRELEDNRT